LKVGILDRGEMRAQACFGCGIAFVEQRPTIDMYI